MHVEVRDPDDKVILSRVRETSFLWSENLLCVCVLINVVLFNGCVICSWKNLGHYKVEKYNQDTKEYILGEKGLGILVEARDPDDIIILSRVRKIAGYL